jgi:hypothetical protein
VHVSGPKPRILEDLRLIDSAIDQYAIETNKAGGASVGWDDVRRYLKVNSALYNTGADVLGNSYGSSFEVDKLPPIPSASYSALSDVAPAEFWSPFQP